MTVYVDLLFGLNTFLNYLLLRGAAAMGGVGKRTGRLVGAAAVGGLYAVLTLLPGLAVLAALPGQAAAAAAMVVLAFGWRKSSVKQGLYFLALSFALSGVVLLAVELLEPDLKLLGGRAYYAVSTPALLLLAALSYGLAALVLQGVGRHTGGDLTDLTLTLGERTVTLRALRDTGNTLRDPLTGEGVVVAGRDALAALLPGSKVTEGELRDPAVLLPRLAKQFPSARLRLVPFHAVGVEAGLLLALRCRAGKRPVLVAFSPTAVGGQGSYNALLGGQEA